MFHLFLLLLSCKAPQSAKPIQPTIRYRTEESASELATQLLQRVPKAQWDSGLEMAAQELLSSLSSPESRITAESAQVATARAGFPGQARFAKMLNGGAFPQPLVEDIREDALRQRVDVALVKRDYADGRTLWLAGWAKHLVEVDPVPRQIALDTGFPLRVEIPSSERGYLYISPPDRPIEMMEILPEAHRWINDFYTPGVYRFELVTDGPNGPQVALLFSVYVDQDIPPPKRLSPPKQESIHPIEAEQWLYAQLNEIRQQRGLPNLLVFPLFEPIAREHSAWMASTGVVDHSIPGVTNGVAEHAARFAHPRAKHYENVVAAGSAEEALELIVESPGHFRVLLCEKCTHVAIGAALEPKITGNPRIFVTWEVLEFPQGAPVPIEKLNRY